jgi:iron complex outermembrane recepter protein
VSIEAGEDQDLSASVARQNNFGGLWNSFALRGFVGDENLPSNYLVNGFNAGRGFGGSRDLSGVERVEVLKGPRAALFGRGEPGGTVNLVTKRPTFDQAGEVLVTAGRFDFYRADADWTMPLGDGVAMRLVGYVEDAGSFRDVVETEKHGLSPSIAWLIGDVTRLDYELEYSRQDVPFDRGTLAIDGELDVIPRERFLGEPGDGRMRAKVLGHQLELAHAFNDDWSALAGFTWRDTALAGFSTEPELTASRQQLFVDGETLTRQRRFRDYDSEYWVLRAEVSGRFMTGPVVHRVLVGADRDQFETDLRMQRARAPTLASGPTMEELQAINVFAPVYGQYPLPEPDPLTDRVETEESAGLFVQNQISLTDRFDVRLGLRYDDYRKKLVNRMNDAVTRQNESRLSPQIGAVYQATNALSLYAAYGENFRPLTGADFQGNAFDPNVTTSVEVGTKFVTNDGALSGTVSVFQIDQKNILVADPVNAGFRIAGGKARSQGLEVDLQGQLTSALSIWLSYAFVDAEMRNDVFDSNFGEPIRSGDRLLNIPKHTLSTQLFHDRVFMDRPLRFGGGALYVGKRSGEVATDFELPSYTLFSAFMDYRITEQFDVSARVDNLTDETWYSNSFSQLWIQPGTPRTFRLGARFQF